MYTSIVCLIKINEIKYCERLIFPQQNLKWSFCTLKNDDTMTKFQQQQQQNNQIKIKSLKSFTKKYADDKKLFNRCKNSTNIHFALLPHTKCVCESIAEQHGSCWFFYILFFGDIII